MKKVLLVQPDWPAPARIHEPQRYFPFPLLKLAAVYRRRGDKVALVIGNQTDKERISFSPDVILVSTVFSYWYTKHVKECITRLQLTYPKAQLRIGGVHASLSPEVYRQAFPHADVHVGIVPEAEEVEPAWDLLPYPRQHNTQILRFSSGCNRRCPFCYNHREEYKAFSWVTVAKKFRFKRIILNDNNFIFHPDCADILKHLATFRFGNGDSLTSVEIQGGFDVRILSKSLHLIPLLKAARVRNVRMAWDGDVGMLPMVEECLRVFEEEGYDRRNIRVFMLYNHDLSFDTVIEKLRHFERLRVCPIHSRFRPLSLLHDGYVPQKKRQEAEEYYIHPGWDDRKVRAVGSISSDISKMVRANASSLNAVRAYYRKPSFEQTLAAAA